MSPCDLGHGHLIRRGWGGIGEAWNGQPLQCAPPIRNAGSEDQSGEAQCWRWPPAPRNGWSDYEPRRTFLPNSMLARLETALGKISGNPRTLRQGLRIAVSSGASGNSLHSDSVSPACPRFPVRQEFAVQKKNPDGVSIGVCCWRRRSESNRRMRDLQSRALPLGYGAMVPKYHGLPPPGCLTRRRRYPFSSPEKRAARGGPVLWSG